MNFLELFNKTGLIAAHRGVRSIAPENTLLALEKSVGDCDLIEVDIRFSSDGIAIVFHDDTLCQKTNISDISSFDERKPYQVCDFTFDELCTLDYGSWFYKEDPFKMIEDGVVDASQINTRYEPLLTLEKTLEFVKKNNLFINIEIKDIHDCFSDEYIVSNVLDCIKKHKVEHLVLISSFRHEYVYMSKQMMPNIPTAAIFENEIPSELLDRLKALRVDACHLESILVNEGLVKRIKKAGFLVNVFTVNNIHVINRLFDIGVTCVFSDFSKSYLEKLTKDDRCS